jgi:hypothetical protein
VHEAGHALVCRLLDVPVETVTIEWSGTSHGALVYAGTPPPESLLLILLAGEAATTRAERVGWLEQLVDEGDPAQEDDDIRVTSDAHNIEMVLEQLYPDDRAAHGRALNAARDQVDVAVEQLWAQIVLVAGALLDATTMSGDEIRQVIASELDRTVS